MNYSDDRFSVDDILEEVTQHHPHDDTSKADADLLIDEILAVGDINFQKKCIAKIKEFKKKGVTMVFVSHNMNDVLEICDSVVWLDKGRMIEYGDTEAIAEKYLDEMNRRGNNE